MATLRNWLQQGPFTLALSSSFFGYYAHSGAAEALLGSGHIPGKITGSSAGALVGGALCSGLSPEATRDLLFGIRREDFWDPFPGLGYLRGRKFLGVLERHFVPDFAGAKIPLEVAVFDLLRCRTRFLSQGSLPQAIVASCAVPLLFHPVRIDGKLYIDGGVFHKSGMKPGLPEERVLCVFLQSKGLSDAYELGRSLGRVGREQRVLRLKNLPRVHYNSLETGKQAHAEALARVRAALDRELSGHLTDA
ncbi:MAG TPA: patatin-like phospholipase family protein [Bdellovibrionota bacterium]|jgi:NTE family protein